MTITSSNTGVADVGGTLVDIVSLLGPNATEANSPAVINGNVRKRIILADPLTGAPLDLAAGVLTAAQAAAGATGNAAMDVAGNVYDLGGLHRFSAPARANKQIVKAGATAYNLCLNNITIGTTTLTHVLSNEQTGPDCFQSYLRKCTISAASNAQIRFTGISATADQTQNSFSVRVYIENMLSEFNAPNNPFITVQISPTTNLGANYSRWAFDSTYLRQGWNILRMRRDDTVSATTGAGNLPVGCSHSADVGTGFDWTAAAQFVSISFDNMNGFVVHIDELRRSAKGLPILVLGFDASGSGAADDLYPRKVAPMMSAACGMRSYVTMTNIYELINQGPTGAWPRIALLHDTYGWAAVNHTWSHGATDVGRVVTLTSLSRTSNVCTATVSGGHSLALNKTLKLSIQGATPSDMNGTFDVTVTSTTVFTYTAAGSDGSATGTVKLYTFLSEVLNVNNPENLQLLRKEVSSIAKVLRGSGLTRGRKVMVMPNNSVPHIGLMTTACGENGIKFVRGARGGYAFKDELGPDNPLHMGSFVMDSGATTFTKLSTLQAKVQGAVDRGDDIWIYGHFIIDDEDPANIAYVPVDPDFPPGQGGNPNPPAGVSLSGFGGWWYYSQLRKLVQNTIAPLVASGQLLVMPPDEYAEYQGGF